jgi:hypothetical protein
MAARPEGQPVQVDASCGLWRTQPLKWLAVVTWLRNLIPGPCQTGLVRSRSAALALVAASSGLYLAILRRRVLTWGATEAEAKSPLPGDELLARAGGVSTRAISIDAPAAAVWPWLAQMGPSPRGGAYTYDWIENLLRLNMHSVDHVIPEFQHPAIGDKMPVGASPMRLERVEPEHVLAWCSEDGNWVWTFVIERQDGGSRLISRNRYQLPTLAARFAMFPMELGSLVMEVKMLHGIKARAEGLTTARPDPRDR